MISQEINLYQERFKEKKLILSAVNVMILLSLVIVAVLVSSYFYADMRLQAELENEQLQIEKENATQRLANLKSRLERILADNQYELQIRKVSDSISARNNMLRFIENSQFGSGEGFSKNLEALTNLKRSDLWLNEIALTSHYVKLSGSALNADSVPEYFVLVQNEEIFKGQQFDIFELDRDLSRDWKVDFVIASRAVSDE